MRHLSVAYAEPLRLALRHDHPLAAGEQVGLAEVAEGELQGTSISVASAGMLRTSTAKQVDAIERDIGVDGEVMTYELRMAAMGKPLDGHLLAELRLGATH